jgi:uncharacterized protein YggE
MNLIKPIPGILFLCCLGTLVSFVCAAQANGNGEIISEGSAKIKIQPDVASLSFSVVKKDSVEKNALAKLNKEISALSGMLARLGIRDKEIKISAYDISSSDSRYDITETKVYSATNSLALEFTLNAKLLDAIYAGIHADSISDVDIRFETKLSDSLDKITRKVLVQKAIADAEANAKNIAGALKLKLVKVKQVLKRNENYPPYPMEISGINFPVQKIEEIKEDNLITSFYKFNVEDIELEEKITIVFESSK